MCALYQQSVECCCKWGSLLRWEKVCLISLQLWPGGRRCEGRAFNEIYKDGNCFFFFSLLWRSKPSCELFPWREAFRSFPVNWRLWIGKCFHLLEFCRFDATRPLTSCCQRDWSEAFFRSSDHLNSSANARERRPSAIAAQRATVTALT